MEKSKKTPDWRLLVMLGLPSFGLTFAVTILSAFLPSVLADLTNPVIIGLIIGAEGFFGLFMPLIMGNLADRASNIKGRFRYIVPATGCMAAALVLMGFMGPLLLIGAMVALFYLGYYSYLAPYWAIYPDLIPKKFSGRSRSAESAWRVSGALIALVSGGFLLSLARPLPFILAAGILTLVTIILFGVIKRNSRRISRRHETALQTWQLVRRTVRQDKNIRNLLIANALLNATLRSILTFTVLFFTLGLGRSHGFVSGVIFPIAAIGMLIMAPLSGKLADSFGHIRILLVALVVYGVGDIVPGLTQHTWVIAFIPLVSGAAATVMTLPYAVMMRLLDGQAHGAASGLFGISRGVGSFFGPILSGVAVVLGRSWFKSTHGFGAFWVMSGIYCLVSLWFVWRIKLEPVSAKN